MKQLHITFLLFLITASCNNNENKFLKEPDAIDFFVQNNKDLRKSIQTIENSVNQHEKSLTDFLSYFSVNDTVKFRQGTKMFDAISRAKSQYAKTKDFATRSFNKIKEIEMSDVDFLDFIDTTQSDNESIRDFYLLEGMNDTCLGINLILKYQLKQAIRMLDTVTKNQF